MKKNKKKIVLNSQTIRNLRPQGLENVQGGIPVTSTIAICGGGRACG